MTLFSIFSRKTKPSFKTVSSSEFKELLAMDSIQLLDVRTPAEFAQKQIEGAILINLYDKDFENQIDKTLNINIPVAVYCHSGVRSRTACRLLATKGYTVYNLRGGLIFWR